MASKVSRQAVPTLSKDRHLTIYSHWEKRQRGQWCSKEKGIFDQQHFGWWSSYERYMSCRRDMGNNNSFWNSFKHQNINRHMKHCNNTLPRGRIYWNIAKGTTDPRVEFIFPKKPTGSYHKFKHKFWSNFIFKISIKHFLQNLNQTSYKAIKHHHAINNTIKHPYTSCTSNIIQGHQVY